MTLYFLSNFNFIELILTRYKNHILTHNVQFLLMLKLGLNTEKELEEYINIM